MSNIPLDQRVNWVGASESAALFGLSPFSTPYVLWHEKAGLMPPDDLDNNERVNAGRFLEPSIAEWAAHKWKWPIQNIVGYLPHPSVKGMGASLDFETMALHEPVEIKNVDRSVFYDPESEWDSEGDMLLDAPLYYLLQVQHQIACQRERPDRGWLVACVGGNQLFRLEVPANAHLIRKIELKITDFWLSVEQGAPPSPNFEADASAIAALYQGRGVECADLRGNEHATRLAAAYLRAHEAEKSAAATKKATLAELKFLMHDARAAVLDNGYSVKASHVPAGQPTARAPHWRFSIKHKETT